MRPSSKAPAAWRSRRRGIRLAACFAAFGLLPAAGASGATFTVNSTADEGDASAGDGSCATAAGVCTLRAAIQEANAFAGTDTIAFAIPGPGPYIIAVNPALPIIIQPLILDAQTQPGWTTAGPVVRVDGAAAPAADVGLQVDPDGDDSVIRGLMITGFGSHGVLVASGADRITIAGNWIGTTGTGSTGVGNGFRSASPGDGLVLGGSLARIGGPNAADRNVITNSRDEGIDIRGAGVSGNIIQGNFIGVDPDGASGNGNGDVGIAIISGSGNTIGGLLVAERNVISRNIEGIEINTADNVVQGNHIGTDVTGTLNRGSRSDDGIEIQSGATGNTIGGTATGAGNLIAFNALRGVNVVSGSGNAVLGNSIHSNGNLGIDLLNDGVTPNDGATTVGQPNVLMDFPVITSATLAGTSLAVFGYVGNAAGLATFANARVEFFKSDNDATGYGEGQTYLGFLSTDTTSGNFGGTLDVAGKGLAPGDRITATATDAANNTSEFGANASVAGAPYVVLGRLFEDADFAGTASGWDGGVADLALANVDVEIYDDGTNAYLSSTTSAADGTWFFTGLANGSYKVRVRSATVGDADTPPRGGLNATVPGTWPYPLAEMTWANGAARYGGQSATVDDTATGDNAGPGDTYVMISVSGANVADVDFGFAYNLIVNTDDDANVAAVRSKQGGLRQFIKNANAIGTAGGTTANSGRFRIPGPGPYTIVPATWLPSITDPVVLDGTTQPGFSGTPIIELDGSATTYDGLKAGLVIVAGNSTVRGLVINRFTVDGIRLETGSNNVIEGNYIGTDTSGLLDRGNIFDGVFMVGGSAGNRIGGLLPGQGNVISGNNDEGIDLRSGSANVIQGNLIGITADGTSALGNGSDGVQITGGTGNAVTANRIAANDGLGIDLSDDGVTANDAGDGDAGPNGLLNFPVLLSGVASGGLVVGTFSLDVPAGSYRVEFFRNPLGADPSGNGEGQVFAGSTVVVHPGTGSRFFPYSISGVVGDIVTATATVCTNGGCTAFGSTSEFGNALTVVTTAVRLMSFEAVGWDGAVELRWRTGSELDNLGFHLYRGPSPSGPWTRLTSSLIPGLGSSPVGESYAWLDSGLANGVTYYYRLEDVDTASVSTFHGPVSATPGSAVAPPGGGSGGGSDPTRTACPSWVLGALGTSSSGAVECTRHGDPDVVSLDVLSRTAQGATLELRTGGFWAAHAAAGARAVAGFGEVSGTVRVFVPGFDMPAESSAPALPVRRALVEAVVGKQVRLVSAEAFELRGFEGLRPSAVGIPEMAVGGDGTVRPARRAVAAARLSRGYVPESVARVSGTVFQGEAKSAVVEMTPVRFDGSRGRLELAGRVVVRLEFTGQEPGETGTGRTGRALPRKRLPLREVPAQLHTRGRGLHAVSFEEVFPGRRRGVSVSQLRLQRQGGAVGFRVEPAGAVFGPGSTLFFFADDTASSTDYASEVAWELVRSTLGTGTGMGVVLGTPQGGPPASSSLGLATFETNRIYQAGLLEAPDVWLWEGMVGGNPARTVSLGLSGVDAASAQPAQLTMFLQGGSASGTVGEHHVEVSLNGALVGDGRFAGKNPYRLSVSVPASQLLEGANSLSLRDVGDTGVSSLVFLDKVSVSYPQAPVARGGVFEGAWAEAGTAEVGGVTESPAVLDVTLAGAAKWVLGVEAGAGSVRFRAEAGHRYVVVSREGWLAPRVERPQPSTLRDRANQADYLLVAPRAFLPAAEPLLVRREGQGLATKAVAFEEIAEVFGHGQPSAEAIREFLAFAYHSWSRPSPRYVVLLGDSTYDPRHFLASSWASPLPALWAKTSYLWTVSDPMLAAVNGDDALPDLAIGRLPAQKVGEAEALVSKLLAWEDSGQDLSGKAVLVADDPDVAGDFEADVADIERGFLAGRPTEVLKLRERGASMRPAIQDAFDAGAALMSYVGHGGAAVWASENVWNSWDAASLQAQSAQPLLLTMNCLNGYFVAPNFESLSEAMLKAEGRGAIAAFSPSGLSLDAPAHQYHRAVTAELTGGEHERLGDAILAAQKAYAQSGLMPELLAVYQLLGDPATPIR